MSKRKYDHYEVASNQPGEEETYYNYRAALSHFLHIKGYGSDARATLWGVDEMGDYHCIMSF